MNIGTASEISSKLSELLPTDLELIPRREQFLANGKNISDNFQKYIANRILRDLSNTVAGKSLNIMMYGHPSLGKTTELRKIISLLCRTKKFKETFLPLYSELQQAETNKPSTQGMWPNILSGSILSDEISSSDHSFEGFVEAAAAAEKVPLIIIDTLDILLADEITGERNATEKWDTFLSQASDLGAAVIWTCRPYEWNTFKEKLTPKTLKRTMDIELPRLQHEKCKPFPISKHEDNDRWQSWSQHLQSYMPLFAGRWSVKTNENHYLPPHFISSLDDYTHLIWNNPLGEQNQTLPSTIYYNALWIEFNEIATHHKQLETTTTARFQGYFERQIMDLFKGSRTHRLRFETEEFKSNLRSKFGESTQAFISHFVANRTQKMKKRAHELVKYTSELSRAIEQQGDLKTIDLSSPFTQELEEYISELAIHKQHNTKIDEDLTTLLEICTHIGLLKISKKWFEFSHQLLLEETEMAMPTTNVSNYNFPSIALRKLTSGSGKDLKRREAELARVHWTGAVYSFHPDIGHAENVDWNLWIEEAFRLGLIDDTEANETNEKNLILREYMDSSNEAALFLRGAPGTGKTYFCLNFIVEHLKTTSRKMLWRYVTLNRPLVDSVQQQWLDRENQPQNNGIIGMQRKGYGPRSVEEIIMGVLRESKDAKHKSIQLLDFAKFKRALNAWFAKYGQGTTPPPAYTNAWSDFTTIFHHSSGDRNSYIGDEGDYFDHEDRKVKGTKIQFDLFAKFCFYTLDSDWRIYANASYLAREQLSISRGKSNQQYDMLMIDEVQDITPSTMALLLLLLRPQYQDKTILIAGDDLQTVNRSGFAWYDFCRETNKILVNLTDRIHPEIERLLGFGISQDVESDLKTLKQVYRNAPKIATLNDTLRNTFANQYPSETMPNYPREFLQISEMAEKKNSDCKISFIWAPEDTHIDQIIQSLSNNAKEISITSKTSIITPYESTYGSSLNSIGNFTTYNGETVKGLEFSGVVLFNPYEMLYSDAEGNLNKGLKKEGIEERIRTWMKRDSEPSKHSVKNFTQLYQNIMTRMNVLVSRPEYRLLVVSRQPFPSEKNTPNAVKINSYHDNPESIIFSLPTLSRETTDALEIEILDMSVDSKALDTFLLATLKRENNMEGYSIDDYLRWALDEAQVGNFDNEKQSWSNLLEVKDEDLKKPLVKAIPHFSVLLLSGMVSGSPGSYIGDSIKIPTILSAFRHEYRSQKNWSDVSSESGACEEIIIPLVKSMKEDDHSIPIEMYYSFLSRFQTFLEEVLKDASTCAEHHPYILHLVAKEILGISIDEREIQQGKPITIDQNLSLDSNQKPDFTPPRFEDIISRSNGGRIKLDPQEHIIDKTLLHIYNTIDRSVVDYTLTQVFPLPSKTREAIELILTSPEHSPFWNEMKKAYDWNNISKAPRGLQDFLADAINKHQKQHAMRDIWGLDSTNRPLIPSPLHETFAQLIEKHKNRPSPLYPAFMGYLDDDEITPDPTIEKAAKEAAISHAAAFMEIILIDNFEKSGGKDINAKRRDFFNSPLFWTKVVERTLEELAKEAEIQFAREQSMEKAGEPVKRHSFHSTGRNLWDKWYYNIETTRKISKSHLQSFLMSLTNQVMKAPTLQPNPVLALEIILTTTAEIKFNLIRATPTLTEEIIDVLLQSDSMSEKAISKFMSSFKDLLAGPRATLKATKRHVAAGQAEQEGETIVTSTRPNRGYTIPASQINHNLAKLFQILQFLDKEDPEVKRNLKQYYNIIYSSTKNAAKESFAKLPGKTSEEEEEKRRLSQHFYSLVETFQTPHAVLNQIQPVGWDESMSDDWSDWLASLLFGVIQHYELKGGGDAKVSTSYGAFEVSSASLLKETFPLLKDYFEQHFSKSNPHKFFQTYFSMLNCGTHNTVGRETVGGEIGILTDIESHFIIAPRTAFFIAGMTRFLDNLESKPGDFESIRAMNPMAFHPAYYNRKESGISTPIMHQIQTSKASSKKLAEHYGLRESEIQNIRRAINFIPFYENNKNQAGDILTNKGPNIAQSRMSAYDLSYHPRKGAEDGRKDWIINNLNGLAEAYFDTENPNFSNTAPKIKTQNRIKNHILHASANTLGLTKPKEVNLYISSDQKLSLGRTLSIQLLNPAVYSPGRHTKREVKFDHILDWRIMYELWRLGTVKGGQFKETEKEGKKVEVFTIGNNKTNFDQFILSLVDIIRELDSEELQFSELLKHQSCAGFYKLISNPSESDIVEKIFGKVDIKKFLRGAKFNDAQFYFITQNDDNEENQRKYIDQICWTFIEYVMNEAGYIPVNTDNKSQQTTIDTVFKLK